MQKKCRYWKTNRDGGRENRDSGKQYEDSAKNMAEKYGGKKMIVKKIIVKKSEKQNIEKKCRY